MTFSALSDELAQEAADTYIAHGKNQVAAASELGIARSTLQNRLRCAAKKGMLGTSPVLPGFCLSKTTSVYNQDGDVVREFVQQKPDPGERYQPIDGMALKGRTTWTDGHGRVTQQVLMERADAQARIEAMRAALEAMKEEIPRALSIEGPSFVHEELLNQFTITDSHMGCLAWAEEGGSNYDLKTAEGILINWFMEAIRLSPKAHTAVLAQLGDLMHHDALESVTPVHRHVLDADSRLQKVIRVVIRTIRRIIAMLLETHAHVHVIMAEGNHDPASSAWLREMLASMYEDEPRISIDASPNPYYAYEWGKTALFFHHGHRRSPKNVDTVFAAQFRDMFGRTTHAYAHLGHKHTDQVFPSNLMKVEQHETLAARDSYAAGGGWFSGRTAKVITYTKSGGEVFRHTISAEMVLGAHAA